MTVPELADEIELPMMFRLGVGATPIDVELVDDFGDACLWEEPDDLFNTRLTSL